MKKYITTGAIADKIAKHVFDSEKNEESVHVALALYSLEYANILNDESIAAILFQLGYFKMKYHRTMTRALSITQFTRDYTQDEYTECRITGRNIVGMID